VLIQCVCWANHTCSDLLMVEVMNCGFWRW